jgi:hypothetical protein
VSGRGITPWETMLVVVLLLMLVLAVVLAVNLSSA